MSEREGPSLRALVVCQNDFDSPTEKQALWFARELCSRGHEVMITVGGDPATGEREGAAGVAGLTVRAHRFRGRRLRDEDRAAASAFGPSLVHAFNSRAPTVAATADLAAATGAPVFAHFEDDEWRHHPGLPGESLYRRGGRAGRRLAGYVRPASWPQSNRASLRWVRRHATAFDALTPALAGEVTRRFGRPCAVVLPVNPPLLEPAAPSRPAAPPGWPEAAAVALFTGTIWPVYREDVLLGMKAVAELQRRDRDVAFVHAGQVHPRMSVERLAREAGLRAASAAGLPYVPFERVPDLLRRASILLQPGAPTEFNRLRLPAKMQAYLASGTPTITFAVGFGELLVDREEALKTHTGEPGELADRMLEVLDDADLRARLQAGGPAAARRLFDPRTNADALVAHYRRHLSPAGRVVL